MRCHTCSYDGHGDVTRSLSEKTGIPTARYDEVNLHITNQGAPWQFRRFRSIDYSQYFPKMIKDLGCQYVLIGLREALDMPHIKYYVAKINIL